MTSLTNKIIANIKSASTNLGSSNFINSENVICIDSSNNRIGINTKNPEYAIDISGNTDTNALRSYNLIITNLADIIDISTNIIVANDISTNEIDISFGKFNELSGNVIDASFIIVNDISIDTIFIPSIFSEQIYSTDISANILTVVTNLTTNNLTVTGDFNKTNLDTSNIKISVSGEIVSLINNDLSSNLITVDEISANTLYVNENAYFLEDACFNRINVNGSGTFNGVNVTGTGEFNNINVTNDANFISIETGTLKAASIVDNANNPMFNSTSIGTPYITGYFDTINANNINIVDSTGEFKNIGKTNLSEHTSQLILPNFDITIPYSDDNGSMRYDNANDILKIYSNGWNEILFTTYYATIKLSEISGNDVTFNNHSLSYFIENSNNLILDITDNNLKNYKYIPLKINNNLRNYIDVANYKTITPPSLTTLQLYEINASVSIKYLNKIPGDVEPNKYTFGLYPNYPSGANSNPDSVANSYVTITNSILAFDNSFNYANSSLSFIGKLNNASTNSINPDGFNFYISSTKDINYLAIDSFNCTIKRLQ